MSLVPKNDDNLKKCACEKCPSYSSCAKEKKEKLYCSGDLTKSCYDFSQNGCSCVGCPVHYDYSLASTYYCIKGSAEVIG